MSYLFYALGLYLATKCLWEAYLYFFNRKKFDHIRAIAELGTEGDGEDIDNPFQLFIAYPFLIGACFMIGYLVSLL